MLRAKRIFIACAVTGAIWASTASGDELRTTLAQYLESEESAPQTESQQIGEGDAGGSGGAQPSSSTSSTSSTSGQTTFYCSFDNGPTDCGFREQAKVQGRATLTSTARDGSRGVRLHTKVGDNYVAGSGKMERNDLWITPDKTGCPKYGACEGRVQWWAHSIYLPSDFQAPTWHSYVLMNFHNTKSGSGQANFHVAFKKQSKGSLPGRLAFVGNGASNTRYSAIIGLPVLNRWYDFVYQVRWSSGSDGYFNAWVNGQRVLSHRGPTLYAGQGTYLKLANYHAPICEPFPGCIGKHKPSSVIHDRVRRGTTALSVARGPVEGVLEVVNGQLVPVK